MRKEIGMVENSALYQKLPFYEGEEEKLLTFCGAEGYAITVYNREELDELAYKVHASNNLSALTRKEFFELRANDRKAHVRLVKKFERLAEKLGNATGRRTTLYDLADGKITLVLDTNYEGMYAPKETWDVIETARKIVNRAKGFKLGQHSAHVCCYITHEDN